MSQSGLVKPNLPTTTLTSGPKPGGLPPPGGFKLPTPGLKTNSE